MLPKSSQHYIEPAAEELNKDRKLVEAVVEFYFTAVRKALSELRHQVIKVDNLGSFKARIKPLVKLTAKYEAHLKVLEPGKFQHMKIKKDLEEKLEEVRALKQLIDSEIQRKKDFKQIKDEYIRKNMERKETNP